MSTTRAIKHNLFGRYASPKVIKALIGNKCDLEEQRMVDFKEASEYASSLGTCLCDLNNDM
jgi:hypothetical protein